ncbi:MAG: hypothetical protein P1P85_04220 [Patescibacteria group bacterium]|nr:hypothetical protein [Patescibacteria group bacterium]
MKKVSTVIVHNLDGNEKDAEKFVEIDGKKFEQDDKDPAKAKVGEDGNPVPYKEKDDKGKNGDGGKKDDDVANKSLEELAKVNPAIAKMLDEKKEMEKKQKEKEAEEKKKKDEKAEKNGEWKELAEERKTKAEKLQAELDKNGEILGKYVNSVKAVLENVMETIPEEHRGLVPEDFSPRQKLEYITKNQKLLGAKVSSVKGGKVIDSDKTPSGTEEENLLKEIDKYTKKSREGTLTAAEGEIFYEKAKLLKQIRAKKDLNK